MASRFTFASRVFMAAAVYGLAVLVPQYFMEQELGRRFPPPLSHPEHFYGFIGVATAWQFAFLLIARDIRRYRLFMLPAILEKLSFGVASAILFVRGRVPGLVLCFGSIDLLLAVCFVIAFRASREVQNNQTIQP